MMFDGSCRFVIRGLNGEIGTASNKSLVLKEQFGRGHGRVGQLQFVSKDWSNVNKQRDGEQNFFRIFPLSPLGLGSQA